MLVSQTVGLVEREESIPPARWFWESPPPRGEEVEEITLIADLARLREELATEFARADHARAHGAHPRW